MRARGRPWPPPTSSARSSRLSRATPCRSPRTSPHPTPFTSISSGRRSRCSPTTAGMCAACAPSAPGSTATAPFPVRASSRTGPFRPSTGPLATPAAPSPACPSMSAGTSSPTRVAGFWGRTASRSPASTPPVGSDAARSGSSARPNPTLRRPSPTSWPTPGPVCFTPPPTMTPRSVTTPPSPCWIHAGSPTRPGRAGSCSTPTSASSARTSARSRGIAVRVSASKSSPATP